VRRDEGAVGRPIRVLVADDDAAYAEVLRRLIEDQPELAVVGTARDGLHAIELAEALEPDAAVIDLHMPLLDGMTAVARLRHDHPNLCLIALTGDDRPEYHSAAKDAGADAVVLKANLVETLTERLRRVAPA
jgi:DNA-binding NarL/FixJ family response regulator